MTIARVRTVLTGVAGSPYYANHYFLGTGALAAPGVAAFWNAVKTAMRNQLTIKVEPEIAQINEATGDIVGYTSWAGATHQGGSALEFLPPHVQLVLQFRTGGIVNNRRVRGRFYVPGLTEADSTAGAPTTQTQVDWPNHWNTHVRPVSITDTNPQVVWCRPTPVRAGTAHQITSVACWGQWGIQRRRRD